MFSFNHYGFINIHEYANYTKKMICINDYGIKGL